MDHSRRFRPFIQVKLIFCKSELLHPRKANSIVLLAFSQWPSSNADTICSLIPSLCWLDERWWKWLKNYFKLILMLLIFSANVLIVLNKLLSDHHQPSPPPVSIIVPWTFLIHHPHILSRLVFTKSLFEHWIKSKTFSEYKIWLTNDNESNLDHRKLGFRRNSIQVNLMHFPLIFRLQFNFVIRTRQSLSSRECLLTFYQIDDHISQG